MQRCGRRGRRPRHAGRLCSPECGNQNQQTPGRCAHCFQDWSDQGRRPKGQRGFCMLLTDFGFWSAWSAFCGEETFSARCVDALAFLCALRDSARKIRIGKILAQSRGGRGEIENRWGPRKFSWPKFQISLAKFQWNRLATKKCKYRGLTPARVHWASLGFDHSN